MFNAKGTFFESMVVFAAVENDQKKVLPNQRLS